MTFSEKLKNLMSELGLSQSKLSDLTGIGKSSISQYLSGKNEPSKDRKKEIARTLGVQDDYFEQFEPAATVQHGSAINVPVPLIARLMGKSKEFVMQGLRDGVFPWGYAVKMKNWSYFIKKMSNSSLISYTKLSPNHSGQRTHSVDRITPHCVVGQLSCETICDCFPAGRGASCNYGIGKDGRIALCVDENNRSWCSSSNVNDQRAITIECASDKTEPYAMTDAVYASLIDLCTDICKRYGKTKLLWFADKEKTLAYNPAADEMIITVHRWFASKSCPGDWLYNRLGDLAAKVTAKLGGGTASNPSGTLYRVQTGAYTKKANADAQLAKVKAAGFDTYMVQAGGYYKIQVGAYSKKENAVAMAAKLKAAGFDTFITTEQGTAVTAQKSVQEIAREVIAGKWGNGEERKKKLIAAGYDYSAVQAAVNALMG